MSNGFMHIDLCIGPYAYIRSFASSVSFVAFAPSVKSVRFNFCFIELLVVGARGG